MTSPIKKITDASHEEADRQLTLIAQQSNALAAPGAAVSAIGAQLDALFAAGAPGDTLDTIQANALALADTVTQHHAALKTSLDLAQRIKAQRDATLTALEDLKDAIRLVDTSVPEIEELYNDVEQTIAEWQYQTWDDDLYDSICESASVYSGLSSDDTSDLLDLLIRNNQIDVDHYLWTELKDWIRRAVNVSETGSEPAEFDDDDSPLED